MPQAAVMLIIAMIATGVLGAPKAKISNDTFDFGMVPQRVFCTHTFWIRNPGTSPIRIAKIEAGCSCTEIPFPDSSIKAGDSLPLGIVFTTMAYRGIVAKRPKFWIDGDTTTYYLKVYANIMSDSSSYTPVRPTSGTIDLSQFGTKERRRATVTLTNLSSVAYKLTVADSVGKSVSISLPKSIPPKGTAELILTVKPGEEKTDFKESITIFLNDEDRTNISIPYRRLYRPDSSPGGTQ